MKPCNREFDLHLLQLRRALERVEQDRKEKGNAWGDVFVTLTGMRAMLTNLIDRALKEDLNTDVKTGKILPKVFVRGDDYIVRLNEPLQGDDK